MAFSMQDLMAGLPGSQPINPLSPTVNPLINPQIDRKQLAGDVADVKDAKNQKLAMMLYALGGALKGDKNFVQNTMALQEMQEGKAKQKARIETLRKTVTNPEFAAKYPWAKDMYDLAGADALSPIVSGIASSYKPTTDSVERFSVFSKSAGRPISSVLKTDAKTISEIQADPDLQIVPLSAPATGKSADIDTWAVTNSEGIRVKDLINPTKEELQEQVKAGNFINKTPVLSTAGKGIEKELGEIRGWNDDGGLLERAMAYKGLVRSGNRIVQNLYDNPESVLAVGDIAQVVDQIGQELTAVGAIVNPEARNTFINKSPQGQDNARIREQFRELASQTALTESQLLDFAYQIAKVRGQEGRGLSDQDFKNFQKIISAGRTAEQKARALTNFIEGIKSEVQGALEDEREYRNVELVRDPENRQANAVVSGIQDVFSTGFADIQNPFMQQQTPPPTTGGPRRIRRQVP